MNGFLKEKKEYYIARLKTIEGWIDILIGTAIWGFVLATYTPLILAKIRMYFPEDGWFNTYLSYLAFGLVSMGLGWVVSYSIAYVGDKVRGRA